MPHHTTDEVDCYREKAKNSAVTKVTAVIGASVLILGLLGTIFGFIMRADSKADNAHLRITELKEDVKEIKADGKATNSKIDKLIGVVTRRLPD